MTSDLLLPPGLFLLMAAAGVLLRLWRRQAGYAVVIAALAMLFIFSTPLGASLITHPLQLSRSPAIDLARTAQAIVVLGAGEGHATDEKSAPTTDLLSLVRLRGAARLARATGLPILVSGGPISDDGPPLGVLMHETLVNDFRRPAQWIESRSMNTAENAKETAAILRASGVEKILLVTQAWHMPRAVQSFQAVGFKVIPAPQAAFSGHEFTSVGSIIPNSRALNMSAYAFHEWIGILWYRVRYGFPFPPIM